MPEKVYQDSVIKESILEPPRQLKQVYAVTPEGTVISEQEVIQRQERHQKLTREIKEKAERKAAWAGKTPPEILLMEMVRVKPNIKGDSTLSVHPLPDGSIDVHLYGRVDRVAPHIVKYSTDSVTWHVTAKGVIQRLGIAAVRPDRPREVLQYEVYQEQADLLRELARSGGFLGLDPLKSELKDAEEIVDPAVRWKTVVNILFLFLRKQLGEFTCQTSQPHPQPQQQPQKAQEASPPKPRRRRPKAKKPAPSHAGNAGEVSQTT